MDVGLRQGSALRPPFFFTMVEVISKKVSKRDILRRLLYADDLAGEYTGESTWRKVEGVIGDIYLGS